MIKFSMEERETLYNYDPLAKRWEIYSNHIPDVRKIVERADVIETTRDDKGRIIDVKATAAPGQIRIYYDK